jgi:hypothetical protein
MTFVVGIGLDRDRLFAELLGHLPQTRQPLVLNGLQTGAVLFDHSLVVLGGDSRQSLRQQIVHRIAAANGYYFTLLAEMIDRLDEQQFDLAVGGTGQTVLCASFGYGRHMQEGSGIRVQEVTKVKAQMTDQQYSFVICLSFVIG